MKYSKEEYKNCGFYPHNEDERNYFCDVVKVRKDHQCMYCNNLGRRETIPVIKKGDFAFYERCILEGEGWRSCYTCLGCLDKWIEETDRRCLST